MTVLCRNCFSTVKEFTFVFLFRDPSETTQPPAIHKEKPTHLPTNEYINTIHPNLELLNAKKESLSLPKTDFKIKAALEKHKEAANRIKHLLSEVKIVSSSIFKPAHESESKGARPKTKRHDSPEDGKRFKRPIRKVLKSPPSRTSLVGRHRRHEKDETFDNGEPENARDRKVLCEVEKSGGEGVNELQTILQPRVLKEEDQLEKDEIAFQESLELKKDEQKEEIELRSLGKNYYFVGKIYHFGPWDFA